MERTLEQAMDHHRAGRSVEAEGLYREILKSEPANAGALQGLGVLAIQKRDFQSAVDLIGRAAAAKPEAANIQASLGQALAGMGRAQEAIAVYQRALQIKDDLPEAWFGLGLALQSVKRREESVAAYRRFIEFSPDVPEAHINLGTALFSLGRVEEAAEAFRRTLALRPDYVEAMGNLGGALIWLKRTDEAIALFRRGLELRPDSPMVWNNLGNALYGLKRYDEAIGVLRKALELKPDFAQAAFNLGNALSGRGQYDQAVEMFRRAIALDPAMVDAHNNLGNALQLLRKYKEAAEAYLAALKQKPDYITAYSNLGSTLRTMGKVDESIAAFEQAIRLQPEFHLAHSNMGNSLKDAGRLDEAIAAYRRAIGLEPKDHASHSNLVFAVQYHEDYDSAEILREALRWNALHAQKLKNEIHPHENDRTRDRRLRIGYVGADFREHCQSLFTIPLLSNHDRKNFEVFCYAHVSRPDATTERIRGYCDGWRSIVGMRDDEVAKKIRDDRIDILVDLTMHMSLGRSLVFARKPAPVQAAWLAYPGTTGLSAMDYRLTDPYLDPPSTGSGQAGTRDHDYCETSIRLADTFWCYDPLCEELEIGDAPAIRNGYITFGCLNNFCKARPKTLELWARILSAAPNSRLILLASPGAHRQRLREYFQHKGISGDRIDFVEFQARREYLTVYRRIDIGLDTLPYNGHTTSLDSMWMGVPVVTCVGKTVVGRAGWSQLCNLDLKQFAAQSDEEFVKIAMELAGDQDRLGELRRTLRERMKRSPLMDGKRFARSVESAYREMWETYCATKPERS
ncbi:MAG TPA: tetratricopeptide repeat protein [Tepidisphaeraceae bacterium]|nr:tetratricopeptide repeat protein [Tepidisphaeraceae bacterium]